MSLAPNVLLSVGLIRWVQRMEDCTERWWLLGNRR